MTWQNRLKNVMQTAYLSAQPTVFLQTVFINLMNTTEKGWIDKVITTNLNYRIPELLEKPYYVEANMSKYMASIIDIINHDVSVEKVRSSNEKIMDLMKRLKG